MILEGILSFLLNAFFSMTSNSFNEYHRLPLLHVFTALFLGFTFLSCEVDDPQKEEVPELITKVILSFEQISGGEPIVATATDPDGEGVADVQIDHPIMLEPLTTYNLRITLVNNLVDATQPEYDVSQEVREEADEHMFFFGWNENLFSEPSGIGNIENAGGAVHYLDEDINGLPLGLETRWTTSASLTGELRIILKHQPDLKSDQSDVRMGETDLDIIFPIIIE
jgi:hypothetical protein